MKSHVWTLPEAARLLSQPQHRLIYLCEQRAVVPDLGEAAGRGSSRRFSARNLLEFAAALKLQELMVPVGAIAAVLEVLRRFEVKVASEIPGFKLPDSLRGPKAAEITAIIGEGPRLYFTIGVRGHGTRAFGGIPLGRTGLLRAPARRGGPLAPLAELPGPSKRKGATSRTAPPGGPSGPARVEISITRIARDLPLDD